MITLKRLHDEGLTDLLFKFLHDWRMDPSTPIPGVLFDMDTTMTAQVLWEMYAGNQMIFWWLARIESLIQKENQFEDVRCKECSYVMTFLKGFHGTHCQRCGKPL